jgi:hypothetical protein
VPKAARFAVIVKKFQGNYKVNQILTDNISVKANK